jgi:hypothetical protein
MISARPNTASTHVKKLLIPNPKLRLREQLREVMRLLGASALAGLSLDAKSLLRLPKAE